MLFTLGLVKIGPGVTLVAPFTCLQVLNLIKSHILLKNDGVSRFLART
jgi:hypothetical protein